MPSYIPPLPNKKENIANTINIKNKTFAIPTAEATMPPKPNIAAMIAITKNIAAHRNIFFTPYYFNNQIIILS